METPVIPTLQFCPPLLTLTASIIACFHVQLSLIPRATLPTTRSTLPPEHLTSTANTASSPADSAASGRARSFCVLTHGGVSTQGTNLDPCVLASLITPMHLTWLMLFSKTPVSCHPSPVTLLLPCLGHWHVTFRLLCPLRSRIQTWFTLERGHGVQEGGRRPWVTCTMHLAGETPRPVQHTVHQALLPGTRVRLLR